MKPKGRVCSPQCYSRLPSAATKMKAGGGASADHVELRPGDLTVYGLPRRLLLFCHRTLFHHKKGCVMAAPQTIDQQGQDFHVLLRKKGIPFWRCSPRLNP